MRVAVASGYDNDLWRSFGQLLRAARLGVGLTQEELSERCGLSVRAISYLETGRTHRPFMKTVRVLAAAEKRHKRHGLAQVEVCGCRINLVDA